MVQRVEVVTSVERRRRFTEDQKLMIVEEASMPGASISATARKHEISPSMIFNWRKKMLGSAMTVVSESLPPPPVPAAPLAMTAAAATPVLPPAVADMLAEIRAEVARHRSTTGNRRSHTPKAIKARVTAALAAGAPTRLIARETGLTPRSVGRCRQREPQLPAMRELKVVADPTPTPVRERVGKTVSIRVGAAATIELPAEALSVELLRALVVAGGSHGGMP
jgi:transposase-like protein